MSDEEMRKAMEFIVNRLAAVTVKGFDDTNAKLNALIDAQIRTEGNLNNLTSVVTKYFSGGQNGN